MGHVQVANMAESAAEAQPQVPRAPEAAGPTRRVFK